MTLSEQFAFSRGRIARQQGRPASANPHDDWRLGVAWAYGWHHHGGRAPRAITWQARLAGLLPPKTPRKEKVS